MQEEPKPLTWATVCRDDPEEWCCFCEQLYRESLRSVDWLKDDSGEDLKKIEAMLKEAEQARDAARR